MKRNTRIKGGGERERVKEREGEREGERVRERETQKERICLPV